MVDHRVYERRFTGVGATDYVHFRQILSILKVLFDFLEYLDHFLEPRSFLGTDQTYVKHDAFPYLRFDPLLDPQLQSLHIYSIRQCVYLIAYKEQSVFLSIYISVYLGNL